MSTTLQEQASVSMEVFFQQRESRAKEVLERLREAGFSIKLKEDGKSLSVKPTGLSDIQKKTLKNLKAEVVTLLKWETDEAAWAACKGERGGKPAYEVLEAWFHKITNPETVLGQQWAKTWVKKDRDPMRVVELFGLYLRALRDSALAVDEGRKVMDDWRKAATEFKRCVHGLHWTDPEVPTEAWEIIPDDRIESVEMIRQRDALCSGLAPSGPGVGDAFEPEEDRS